MPPFGPSGAPARAVSCERLPIIRGRAEHASFSAMEIAMRRIGLLLYPDFQILCFAVIPAFEGANRRAGERVYDLHVLSERGGLLKSSLDIHITTEAMAEDDY